MPETTAAPKRRKKTTPAVEAAPQMEVIVQLPLTALHAMPNAPYGVRDDEAMRSTAKSIKAQGVLTPAIVRPCPDGSYEIIAGNRRKFGAEQAGLTTMPCVIRNLDDDAAVIQMVDSNFQRENVLHSERAKAYKMRLEASRRQGARTDLTSPNNSAKFRSDDEIGSEMGVSGDTIRNIISLTQLVPGLMQMVDNNKMALTPAYHLSALTPQEQELLLTTMDSEQATPSISQAQRMKKLSQSGELNEDTMLEIMMEQKKPESWNLSLPMDKIRKYFPKSYTPQRMEETILKLLEGWMQRRQREQGR